MLLSGNLLSSAAGYTQNFIDTNDTFYQSLTGPTDNSTFTLCFTMTPNSVTGLQILFCDAPRFAVYLDGTNLNIEVKDTTGAWILQKIHAGISIATTYHVFLSVDVSGGAASVVFKVNSVDQLGTPTQGPNLGNGTIDYPATLQILASSGGSNSADVNISDLFFETAIRSDSLFYSGGPLDISAVGSPYLFQGNDMTADERGGNTSQGWNDGYNLGSGGNTTVGSATATDV